MLRFTTAPSYEDFDGIGAWSISEVGFNEPEVFVWAGPLDAAYTEFFVIRVVNQGDGTTPPPGSGAPISGTLRDMVVVEEFTDMVVLQ